MEFNRKDTEGIILLMEEAAKNLASMMGSEEAEKQAVRYMLPDELEGAALMLRDVFGIAPKELANGAVSYGDKVGWGLSPELREPPKRAGKPILEGSPHYPFYCALRDGKRVFREDKVNDITEWLTLEHPGIQGNPGNIAYYGYKDLSFHEPQP